MKKEFIWVLCSLIYLKDLIPIISLQWAPALAKWPASLGKFGGSIMGACGQGCFVMLLLS